jgi:hypothetical protein
MMACSKVLRKPVTGATSCLGGPGGPGKGENVRYCGVKTRAFRPLKIISVFFCGDRSWLHCSLHQKDRPSLGRGLVAGDDGGQHSQPRVALECDT